MTADRGDDVRSFGWVDPDDSDDAHKAARHPLLARAVIVLFIVASIPSALLAVGLAYADSLAPAGHATSFRVACGIALGVVLVGTAAGLLWLDDLSGRKAKERNRQP